uniref:F-box protein At2g02240-like n=1 Tax=Erigeron canadensis TaxID=72917 RepID=UPI001CB90025|nr:F-box protein At2g02240-like [Erigeron canadensis]
MKEIEKIKGVQQVPELKGDQVQQLTNHLEDTFTISANDYKEKELSREVDEKKHLIVSASKVLFTPEEIKLLKPKPAAELKSRSEYVMELLPHHVYRIKYEIDSKMLSPFTEYTCYLVFKLSKKCLGLHCPVIVRDKLHPRNKDAKVIYFRTPALWNQHDAIWVPKQRKDGWMEVVLWRFNSKRKLGTDSIPMNLKLISYEGSMLGLIVCGLEFRPT